MIRATCKSEKKIRICWKKNSRLYCIYRDFINKIYLYVCYHLIITAQCYRKHILNLFYIVVAFKRLDFDIPLSTMIWRVIFLSKHAGRLKFDWTQVWILYIVPNSGWTYNHEHIIPQTYFSTLERTIAYILCLIRTY